MPVKSTALKMGNLTFTSIALLFVISTVVLWGRFLLLPANPWYMTEAMLSTLGMFVAFIPVFVIERMGG